MDFVIYDYRKSSSDPVRRNSSSTSPILNTEFNRKANLTEMVEWN